MAAFFSFGSGIDVDVRLADEENRQFVEVKGDTGKGSKGDAFAGRERCPVYLDGEAVKGQVRSDALTPLCRTWAQRRLCDARWGRDTLRRC